MWKVIEHNQCTFDSLFAMILNLYCLRCGLIASSCSVCSDGANRSVEPDRVATSGELFA